MRNRGNTTVRETELKAAMMTQTSNKNLNETYEKKE